jgi:hypothetical protein
VESPGQSPAGVIVLLLADAPAISPIEMGLIAAMSVLTLAAVVFAVRVLRRMHAEEASPDSQPKP